MNCKKCGKPLTLISDREWVKKHLWDLFCDNKLCVQVYRPQKIKMKEFLSDQLLLTKYYTYFI